MNYDARNHELQITFRVHVFANDRSSTNKLEYGYISPQPESVLALQASFIIAVVTHRLHFRDILMPNVKLIHACYTLF